MFIQAKKPPRYISFSCDGCSSEFLETEAYTLGEAMPVLRDSGWAVAQLGDKYHHYCNGCAVEKGVL